MGENKWAAGASTKPCLACWRRGHWRQLLSGFAPLKPFCDVVT